MARHRQVDTEQAQYAAAERFELAHCQVEGEPQDQHQRNCEVGAQGLSARHSQRSVGQLARTASTNQNVRSTRCLNPNLYAGQFVTR